MSIFTKLSCVILFLFAVNQVSFSSPLNGTYTIGAGTEDFATINDAVNAINISGVSGPVVFRIKPGTYNEQSIIGNITGSSPVNTVTFKSFTENPSDVIINYISNVFILNETGNLFFSYLGLGGISINGICSNIGFSHNMFNSHGIGQNAGFTSGLSITDNSGLSFVNLSTAAFIFQNVTISDNVFENNGKIEIINSYNSKISKNKLSNILATLSNKLEVSANKITAIVPSIYALSIIGSDSSKVFNNFFVSKTNSKEVLFRLNNHLAVSYNTFKCEETVDTTVSVFDNNGFSFMNNIVQNLVGGACLISYNNNTGLQADHNNYWNGFPFRLIYFEGVEYISLNSFHSVTGLDENSQRLEVVFTSDADLHLSGTSIGNPLLTGSYDPEIALDIDGQLRSSSSPYKGADEADFPLPVELGMFTSALQNNNVTLHWQTVTEQNNYGFEIERLHRTDDPSENWNKIGFVQGNGNQSNVSNYTFRDNGLNSGKYGYRLKQIDFNGNFQYYYLSNEIVIGIPAKPELSQNYPNPFNPVTKINYSLPSEGKAVLKVYNITGREVTTLVNEIQSSGYYSISFNAEGLSTGIYYYTLSAGNFSETKKMMVIK